MQEKVLPTLRRLCQLQLDTVRDRHTLYKRMLRIRYAISAAELDVVDMQLDHLLEKPRRIEDRRRPTTKENGPGTVWLYLPGTNTKAEPVAWPHHVLVLKCVGAKHCICLLFTTDPFASYASQNKIATMLPMRSIPTGPGIDSLELDRMPFDVQSRTYLYTGIYLTLRTDRLVMADNARLPTGPPRLTDRDWITLKNIGIDLI